MKFRNLLLVVGLFCIAGILSIKVRNYEASEPEHEIKKKLSGPEQFVLFHRLIRTPEGADGPAYLPGFKVKELEKAKINSVARKRSGARMQANGVLEWKERGPVNVPGRTRGIIVDPDDASKNTWFAGSVGGGVWKTTDAGINWTLITPDLTNLSTTVLAMAPSNHDVIYLGTGEGFGNLDGISGNGMFKSTNRGQTWSYLPATSSFTDVNRAIVSPSNADIVVVATNSGIYRTINGGTSWTQVSSLIGIQDLNANPGDFNIQYATQNGVGVLKSVNGGIDWTLSSVGLNTTGRIEIDISPVNTDRIFASTEGNFSGSGSDLYISENAGVLWLPVNVAFNNSPVNFLNGQGWYDNTIMCDPFNADIVYFGGVSVVRAEISSGGSSVPVYGVQDETGFLTLTNFNATQYQGRLEIGNGSNKSIEIRFGSGKSQLAHRFEVPANGGANGNGGPGVPDNQYSYMNYVSVPFEVWEVDENGSDVQQLMVSFRDQQRDGQYNLNVRNDVGDPDLLTAREYVFIHYVPYAATPNPSIAVTGGHVIDRMYFFWPTLTSGFIWNPASLPDVEFKIIVSSAKNSTVVSVADPYGQMDSKNSFGTFGVDMHPDHHNLVAIPMSASAYKILNANDGGLFISNTSATPGIAQGNWTMAGRTYNTSQFYGADKRPGHDEYFGGLQDNGTWRSTPNISASKTTNYIFAIGGDGFEVIWNNLDDQKLIGGSQGNNFRRSTNGGSNWSNATAGLSGDHPFISKLANSKSNPDVIYTLSSAGVFRSSNFGSSWTLTSITDRWGGATSLMDVEVSRANANIVWAGSGMVNSQRNLHVSINGGVNFNATENSPLISGGITKLASHPFEENTAYALFSQAGNPKILRTTDLGQTWNDISGFNTGDVSTNGFPDVAVYCLYVRPDNPDIIWAGTEIGIVESLDNGATWALVTDFPHVSVWDMKGQDDQVVIATHGRGIWTATIEAPQNAVQIPEIIASGTSPKEKLLLRVRVEEAFDKIEFYSETTLLGTLNDVDPSELVLSLNVSPGMRNIKMISYKGTAPFHSPTYVIEHLDILSVENSYTTYFSSINDLSLKGFSLLAISGSLPGERQAVHTTHNYPDNQDQRIILRHPVKVSATLPMLYYSDIAIVEPGDAAAVFGTPEFKDYVVMEGSKNGLDWTPLADGYNALANATWLGAYNGGQPGTKDMFVAHELNLDNTFDAGDTLLIRYRLSANQSINSWGAAVNYITIQQEPTGTENPALAGMKLSLFPNPSNGNFTAEFELSSPTEIRAEILDASGKVVHAKDLGRKAVGTHQETFALGTIPRGNYMVIFKTNKGNKIGKIAVNR